MKKNLLACALLLTGSSAFADGNNNNCPNNMNTPSLSLSPSSLTLDAYSISGSPTSGSVTASIGNKKSGVTYTLSISSAPSHGSASLASPVISYNPSFGYSGSDSLKVKVTTNCTVNGSPLTKSATLPITVRAPITPGATMGASTGNVSLYGAVVLDNTPNPGAHGIASNLMLSSGNAAQGADKMQGGVLQVMQRTTSHELWDEIGIENGAGVADGLAATSGKNSFFLNGVPVIDLQRLRDAADNLRTSISSNSNHPSGTYGTITWKEFVSNVANGRLMQGIVRVKVPVSLQSSSGSSTVKNQLGQSVNRNKIYGFCVSGGGGDGGGSSCSNDVPTDGDTTFNSNSSISGYNFDSGSELRVNGMLFFDFVNKSSDSVNNSSGKPVLPANLPFNADDLKITFDLPVIINEAGGNTPFTELSYIDGVSKNISCGSFPCTYKYPVNQVFDYTQVDQSAKDRFAAQTQVSLSSTLYANLNTASKYHLLMPTGYEQGWASAFNDLKIKASKWSGYGFMTPAAAISADRYQTASDIRSSEFEDQPALLATGGTIALSDHVNISGLVYLSRALDILQTSNSSVRQYFMGGVIVQDRFFIDVRTSSSSSRGITVISSDPNCFSQLRVLPAAGISDVSFKFATGTKNSVISQDAVTTGNDTGADNCAGCAGSKGTESSVKANGSQYVIIRPQL